ncbi:MAG: bifunctional UDP-N-acetylglucosamine diphosphorylase/glucosamine-1-phosphate N-acetyltransferase GlmU [Chthonomonas sp.]|nr:bifunctional UDP-N-acetylglucosamine diphosphorylase/glucosamine-1-phosphate N-acetyltransferase GlmU [Chthonomonas sp.]
MAQRRVAGVILAAGKGTRMKSELPKCAHPVCGLAMVEHIGRAMKALGVETPVLVVGHGASQLQASLTDPNYLFEMQETQEGTGHAAKMAMRSLPDFEGPVLLTPGDTPLLNREGLAQVLELFNQGGFAAVVATFTVPDAGNYGRIVRNASGDFAKIVEAKDCNEEERKIGEVNSAVYCFDAARLRAILPRLDKNNAQEEYLLTDVLRFMVEDGDRVGIVEFPDESIFKGVNNRWELAEAGEILRRRLLREHAMNGVTIVDPATTFIEPDVELEPDCLIEPMTTLRGKTRIGAGSIIGPMSVIIDAEIGRECWVRQSQVQASKVADGVKVGPYAHIRPGSTVGRGCKIGNFVELKNAQLGDKVAAGHLAYLGDATVGDGTNIGAGTITCNYDGYAKHRTTIGANTFVGTNSTLVAPLTIGDGAYIAAGSTITKDIEADSLGIGRARTEEKPQWAARYKQRKGTP